MAEEQPQIKRRKTTIYDRLHAEPIRVLVGPKQERFDTYRRLLRYHSKYFDERLSIDSQDVIEIPKVKPGVFSCFRKWLDTKRVCTTREQRNRLGWVSLAELKVFADDFGADAFANAIMDTWYQRKLDITEELQNHQHSKIDHRRLLVDVHAVTNAIGRTPSNELYALLVDQYAYGYLHIIPKVELDELSQLPLKFLHEVKLALRKVAHHLYQEPTQPWLYLCDFNPAAVDKDDIINDILVYLQVSRQNLASLKNRDTRCEFFPVKSLCNYHIHNSNHGQQRACAQKFHNKYGVGVWTEAAILLQKSPKKRT